MAFSLFVISFIKQNHLDHTREDLKTKAMLVRRMIPCDIAYHNSEEINEFIEDTGAYIDTRITVIMSGGAVIGDSDEDYNLMDNHGDRPEIITAFTGETGMSSRYSYTLKKDLMYVAVPVIEDGRIIGVIRTSMPVSSITLALQSLYFRIILIALSIALVVVAMSFIVTRWINNPIREIMTGVSHFSDGVLSFRIPAGSMEDFNVLSGEMNSMAAQLDDRIRLVTEQRNELDAILTGMTEAVFAVDREGRITECNAAAEKMLKFETVSAKGNHVEEIIRNAHLQSFIRKTLVSSGLSEEEIILYNGEERTIQAHGTQVLDASEQSNGAVIVLYDITHLKKLEEVRRDFVANVSHELKTPITSIIGFVETLKDGAIDDTKNRDKFLKIILEHAERLNGIIEDLLNLSRIEKESENGSMVFEKNNICKILENSIAMCHRGAQEKDISITLNCRDLIVKCNASMLEQAVMNLIDNAVKYSDEGGTINVGVSQDEDRFIIEVHDEGCGIPEEHHPRIFERFYRVDKGRSRKLGGTGLGLAIVKHIVLTHGGHIVVKSSPGHGSTFSIHLPAG